MANGNKRITELPKIITISDSDLFAVVQNEITSSIDYGSLRTTLNADINSNALRFNNSGTSLLSTFVEDAIKEISNLVGINNTFYNHIQATPQSTWLITHNLNRYPTLIVRDSLNDTIHGDIIYINLNTISISFKKANLPHEIAGSAYLT